MCGKTTIILNHNIDDIVDCKGDYNYHFHPLCMDIYSENLQSNRNIPQRLLQFRYSFSIKNPSPVG